MSDEDDKIYIEVTPTSKNLDYDSMLYRWDQLKQAFEDAELTLDGSDDAAVTLRIVKNPKIEEEVE